MSLLVESTAFQQPERGQSTSEQQQPTSSSFPRLTRFNIDVNALSSAKRPSSINSKDQQIEQDKLDNALATLLSSLLSTFVQPSDVPWLLQQLGYPRFPSLSTHENPLQERLIALSWLVAEFDLWEKHTLDNVTHLMEREHITIGSPSPSSSSAIRFSSDDNGLHWRPPPTTTTASSPSIDHHATTTTMEHESLVAAYGQVNHLLRKYKHLRTCHVRNTQALTRSFRRLLDQPYHTTSSSIKATATMGASTSSPPLGTNHSLSSEGWKVTSAVDAVMLLRTLPAEELERLVQSIDHSCQPSPTPSQSDSSAGELDQAHRQLMESLERQVHSWKQCVGVTHGLDHSRRQEAAYYRWMSSCKTLESHPARPPSGITHDSQGHGQGTHDVDDEAEGVPVGILNELEGVVEGILGELLAGGGTATATSHTTTAASSSANSYGGNGNIGSGSGSGSGRLISVMDVHRILSAAETEMCNHLPGLAPRSSTTTTRHNRQHLGNDHNDVINDGSELLDTVMMDHPMYRYHCRRLSTVTLPMVAQDQEAAMMTSLRTIHRDVLHRTAKACSPYSPYDVQFS